MSLLLVSIVSTAAAGAAEEPRVIHTRDLNTHYEFRGYASPEEWENWVEWDVTEIVKNRWSNVADFGFLLRDPIEDMPPPDGPYERFRSRRYESETPGQIPYLTVQVGCLTGDANRDGIINVGDIVYLVTYLYRGGPEPDPPEAGDANCDDVPNVGDVVYLVTYLYKGGLPPGCPGPPE